MSGLCVLRSLLPCTELASQCTLLPALSPAGHAGSASPPGGAPPAEQITAAALPELRPDCATASEALCPDEDWDAETQLNDLQHLVWAYWQRHHGQIERALRALLQCGVQGLLVVPPTFRRQASLAAYHAHEARCLTAPPVAPAGAWAPLCSSAQAFAHLSPALQYGVVWELLLSQWYEGVGRYFSPQLTMRMTQTRSLKRLTARTVVTLSAQLQPPLAPELSPELEPEPGPKLEPEPETPSASASASASPYRGFLAHYHKRPLLGAVRWEQPSAKLDSALKQFMRDPSCRRYRAARHGKELEPSS